MKLTDKELSCAASEAQRIWLSALPQKQDLPQHKFSPDFERRMAHMLATQKRNPHLSVHKALRCAVAAILVVLSLTVGALKLSNILGWYTTPIPETILRSLLLDNLTLVISLMDFQKK